MGSGVCEGGFWALWGGSSMKSMRPARSLVFSVREGRSAPKIPIFHLFDKSGSPGGNVCRTHSQILLYTHPRRSLENPAVDLEAPPPRLHVTSQIARLHRWNNASQLCIQAWSSRIWCKALRLRYIRHRRWSATS